MKLTRFQWLGAALACLAAQGAQAGPVWAGNGHEYSIVSSEGVTWTAARAAATALGAGWDLATITSAAEKAFVVGLLPAGPASRSHFWLGGTDASAEGVWTWVTGEAFTYTDWWGGEPNNSGNEDYLALDYRGSWAWNDAPDNLGAIFGFARGYVIERRLPGQVPEPGTLVLVALGAGALLGMRRRKPR